MMIRRRVSILITLFLLGQPAWASIPPLTPLYEEPKESFQWNNTPPPGYDATVFTKANIEKYVPTNLTPTTNQAAFSTELSSKMGQRITDDIMKGDFFQKNAAAKTMQNLQHISDKSVSFGNPAPGATVHTFKFQMKPVERQAVMDYTGFFNSTVTYQGDSNTTRLAITQPLKKDMTLSFIEITNMGLMDFNPSLNLSLSF